MSEYDPNSHDAVLSRILNEIQQMRATQIENRDKLDNALSRVTALEQFKVWVMGAAAGVSFLVAAAVAGIKWLFEHAKHN